MTEMLLRYGKLNEKVINDAFLFACGRGIVSIASLLLSDSRVNPSINDNLPIQISCSNGHERIVDLLLRSGRVDPTANNNYAIKQARYRDYSLIVKLLLDHGVDPNIFVKQAFISAVLDNMIEIVRDLLFDGRIDVITKKLVGEVT
jgi:ankyrin repeat protein